MRLFELLWSIRIGIWLCLLPPRLRMYTLSALLQHLTPAGQRPPCPRHVMEHLVRFVVRLCQRRLFRTRLFPRACLRQALALYYVLARLGYPVTIHFGVSKAGATLHGHSWVTVEGEPVAERLPIGRFRILYTYPHASPGLPQGEPETCAGGRR